jgi:molybdenum cofactor cytidylyltransferase
MKVVGILLAAGRSQRYGSDKRLQRLPGGDTLIMRAARILRAAVDDLLIVLGPGDEHLASTLNHLNLKCGINPHAVTGMGSSLGYGVDASAEADAWLVMPADLPLLRIDTIHRVVSALTPDRAVVPICHGIRGHPVAFSKRFAPELSALSGDMGGRTILQRYSADVTWLNTHDPGIYRDLDNRNDLPSLFRLSRTDHSCC